ncbi:hypothetical protein [Pseudoalteromonas sp. JC3]|uniref:hypothetical protein n=1 Tax=Pseudoalteromonas sp. JC3 TaxID=2810196 RepID=UPI0019D27846|nr:hypothetical protein [Pseudoalteromonas sp. JC3]MBR8842458.1 hypothetical protein [Pseudoalteromonas sp. JC3]WJE09423.1 hypothetical protein QSH61_02830 [Pseudoalteromonas sp. JC3]
MWLDTLLAFLGIVVVWKVTNCKVFPSPQLTLLVGYLLYYYVGVIINHDEPYLRDSEYFDNLVWLTRSGFLAIFIASVITSRWQSLNFEYYYNQYKQEPDIAEEWLGPHLIPLSILMLALVVLYLLIIPVQPLIIMFTDPSNLIYAREAATVGLSSFAFFSNFFYDFMPLIWVMLFLTGRVKWAYFLLFANLIVLLSTGQKSPVVYVLIVFLCTTGFLRGNFNYAKTFRLFLFAFFILVAIVYIQNAHLFSGLDLESISSSMDGLIRRTFFVGPDSVVGYLSTFPDYHPFIIDSQTDVPPDKIVYQKVYGLDVEGTMNSNSLAFFYGWYGDKHIASVLYFSVIMLFFMTPFLLSFLKAPKTLSVAIFLLFYLLIVKFNITDWYTIYFVFILPFMVINGLLILTKFTLNLGSGTISYSTTYFSVVVSVLMLLYFLQGKVKGLLS